MKEELMKPKKKMPFKRFDKAEKFEGDGWIAASNLIWICPKCGHGSDDPEEARFSINLVQWYEWDMDGKGERQTRYGIKGIDAPKKGQSATCRECNHTFKLKALKATDT